MIRILALVVGLLTIVAVPMSTSLGAVNGDAEIPGLDNRCAGDAESCKIIVELVKRQLPALLSKPQVNADMIHYCVVQANYYKVGYIGFENCLEREIGQRVIAAFGIHMWRPVDACPNTRDSRDCIDEEERSFRELPIALGGANTTAIESCVSQSEPSSLHLLECLRNHSPKDAAK